MHWPFARQRGLTPVLDPSARSGSSSIRFAFKLFRQLGAEQKARNIFFSPASVMVCLWLLQEGAIGETRESMAKALEAGDLDPEGLRLVIADLRSALQIQGPSLQLESANSLWCNLGWTPRLEYVARAGEGYGAEVNTLDFRGADSVSRINAWVSEKTRGKIEGILDRLDPLAALVAINAIYFKDLWTQPFQRNFTREESFATSEGREMKVPLMDQYGTYSYCEQSKFQAVRLGYKTPRLAMYVFLPAKSSTLLEFQRSLSANAWNKWKGKFEMVEGRVRIPRFKLTYQASLTKSLGALGMEIAFDRQRARFDGIHPPPPAIWIDEVAHRAYVEVNEDGTEAAAATAGLFCLSATGKPKRTFKMVVDRPFFFAICDDSTNTILFMGAVEEPVAGRTGDVG